MLCTSLEYHVLVNLPLLALSVPFRWLLPLALASVAFSLGVCVVAGAQADLPRNKRRFWSRPMVALLFFLAAHRSRVGSLSRAAQLRPNSEKSCRKS